MIEKLKLQVLILQLQIQIKLLKKKRTIPNLKGIRDCIVHHGGGPLNFEQVNIYHRRIWGFKSSLGYYVGYQKWIEYDGTLFVARRDNEEGAHTKGFNKVSVGICLQGDMETMKPTEAQLETLKRELDKYRAIGLEIKMHRNFAATLCPGRYLVDWLIGKA